jgi:DNA-binding PadR family transcriptional regulator
MTDSSVNSELSLFSYEILGLVGEEGAGAHDLLRMARHGRILDWAGESQYYVEPKRLAKLGYLEARKEPGKTRERTVYTLTGQGRHALVQYARTPVTVTPFKSDPLLRLLICDLVGEELTRASLATLRDDLEDLRARLDESQQRASELPHREKYLLLVVDFLRGFLQLHEQLVDEVERKLAPPPRRRKPAAPPAQVAPRSHAEAKPGDTRVLARKTKPHR